MVSILSNRNWDEVALLSLTKRATQWRIVAIEPHTQMSKAQGRWWLPGVAVLATLLLLMIGYYFYR